MKSSYLIISLFSLVFFVASLSAQQSGVVVYKKVYTSWEEQRTEILEFDGQKCLYIEKNEKMKTTSKEGYDITFEPRDQKWYLNMASMEVVEQMMDKKKKSYVLWDYPQTPYKWTLHDEYKVIGKYKVQKATAMDKNTAWGKVTAWFTTEIPIPYGPHRLFGLPGLIIEASLENDFEAKYILDTIEFKKVGALRPDEGIWIDKGNDAQKAGNRNALREAMGSGE